jgi:hypothetical protein
MLKSSPFFRRNGVHLIGKKKFEKIRIVHFQNLSVLNMRKLDLCQALNIYNLQLMENVPKTFMPIQITMFSL